MSEPEGLRTLKKERTRQAIADAASELFLAEGFDRVSVAQIAARAEVSKPTLFRYFASKEELVLHRISDHQGEAGRVVRDRPEGVGALAALRQHFLERLAERDPVSGLSDHPQVLAFYRLVFETPSLSAHLRAYIDADIGALAEAFDGPSELADRLLAAQFVAVRQILAHDNWARLDGGLPMPEAYRLAVADAEEAFALLGSGAAQYGY